MKNIIDVSFISNFIPAERIESYCELINFFKKIPLEFYKHNNIYFEKHHIIPKCETTEISETVNLPFYFHFKAHILRAREATNRSNRNYNYSAAYIIATGRTNYVIGSKTIEKLNTILNNFPEEFYESKTNYLKIKHLSWEDAWGKEESDRRKAKLRKSKIGQKVPKHGKSVIHLNTMTIYETINEAVRQTKFPHSSIQKCCCNEFQQCKGQFWQYFKKDVDYEAIYKQKKLNLSEKGFQPHNNLWKKRISQF